MIKIIYFIILIVLSSKSYAIEVDYEKTEWGLIPVSISSKIDEITNGVAATYKIEDICKINTNIKNATKIEMIKRIYSISPDNYRNISLNYAKDSLNQKEKAFQTIYMRKSCSNIEGLKELATVNGFLTNDVIATNDTKDTTERENLLGMY